MLMRVTRFDLLLTGTIVSESPAAFQAACTSLPTIELGNDFSSSDAGEAGAALLQKIEARLNSNSA